VSEALRAALGGAGAPTPLAVRAARLARVAGLPRGARPPPCERLALRWATFGLRPEDGRLWGSAQQRRLVEALLKCALNHRAVLRGNAVAVRLLGGDHLFVVDELEPAGASALVGATVGRQTLVEVAVGREPASPSGPEAADLGGLVQSIDALTLDPGEDGGPEAAVARARALGGAAAGASFARIGGFAAAKEKCRRLIAAPLRTPELFRSYGIRAPRGVLLHGPPGTGKSELAKAAAAEAGATLFMVTGPDLVSATLGESESNLRAVFAAAREAAPAVVFLDEIDALAPAREGVGLHAGGSSSASDRIVAELLVQMDSGAAGPDRVAVVGTTNRLAALDPALRRPGRFDREIEVGVPSPADRGEILRTYLGRMAHACTPAQVEELAATTHGFVPADIKALCNAAAIGALGRHVARGGGPAAECAATWADFELARARVRPSAMREIMVEVPRVRWADVGGRQAVKDQLVEFLQMSAADVAVLARAGIPPLKGVLLYGPPGCSKTMLVRAVATEANLNFIPIKGPELFNKYVGESEKAVKAVFARARAAAPCVVFVDEIDGLANSRGSTADAGDKVTSQLLTELDGVASHSQVYIVAATNRPDLVDNALLRPGRFDRLVYVPAPSLSEREAILDVLLQGIQVADWDCGGYIGSESVAANLALATGGFSAADLVELVRRAGLHALEEDLAAPALLQPHFEAALGTIRPSLKHLPADLTQMYEAFARG